MNGNRSWILCSPTADGKSTIARALADYLGLDHVKDGWDSSSEKFDPMETLHVTNVLPGRMDEGTRRRVLTTAQARELIGVPWVP